MNDLKLTCDEDLVNDRTKESNHQETFEIPKII